MTPDKHIKPALKIGLFGIGLQAYWQQFEGLEQRLSDYVDIVADKISGFGAGVVNLGLIDTPEKAFEAGSKGTGDPLNEDTMSSVILGNSLLTSNGVPVARNTR